MCFRGRHSIPPSAINMKLAVLLIAGFLAVCSYAAPYPEPQFGFKNPITSAAVDTIKSSRDASKAPKTPGNLKSIVSKTPASPLGGPAADALKGTQGKIGNVDTAALGVASLAQAGSPGYGEPSWDGQNPFTFLLNFMKGNKEFGSICNSIFAGDWTTNFFESFGSVNFAELSNKVVQQFLTTTSAILSEISQEKGGFCASQPRLAKLLYNLRLKLQKRWFPDEDFGNEVEPAWGSWEPSKPGSGLSDATGSSTSIGSSESGGIDAILDLLNLIPGFGDDDAGSSGPGSKSSGPEARNGGTPVSDGISDGITGVDKGGSTDATSGTPGKDTSNGKVGNDIANSKTGQVTGRGTTGKVTRNGTAGKDVAGSKAAKETADGKVGKVTGAGREAGKVLDNGTAGKVSDNGKAGRDIDNSNPGSDAGTGKPGVNGSSGKAGSKGSANLRKGSSKSPDSKPAGKPKKAGKSGTVVGKSQPGDAEKPTIPGKSSKDYPGKPGYPKKYKPTRYPDADDDQNDEDAGEPELKETESPGNYQGSKTGAPAPGSSVPSVEEPTYDDDTLPYNEWQNPDETYYGDAGTYSNGNDATDTENTATATADATSAARFGSKPLGPKYTAPKKQRYDRNPAIPEYNDDNPEDDVNSEYPENPNNSASSASASDSSYPGTRPSSNPRDRSNPAPPKYYSSSNSDSSSSKSAIKTDSKTGDQPHPAPTKYRYDGDTARYNNDNSENSEMPSGYTSLDSESSSTADSSIETASTGGRLYSVPTKYKYNGKAATPVYSNNGPEYSERHTSSSSAANLFDGKTGGIRFSPAVREAILLAKAASTPARPAYSDNYPENSEKSTSYSSYTADSSSTANSGQLFSSNTGGRLYHPAVQAAIARAKAGSKAQNRLKGVAGGNFQNTQYNQADDSSGGGFGSEFDGINRNYRSSTRTAARRPAYDDNEEIGSGISRNGYSGQVGGFPGGFSWPSAGSNLNNQASPQSMRRAYA